MKKKAQITFANGPNLVILLVVIGMIAAAGVISLSAMKDGVTARDAEISISNVSTANDTLDNTMSAISNFTSQLGTVGTMMGVGLLVGVVLGVFAFRRLGEGGGL